MPDTRTAFRIIRDAEAAIGRQPAGARAALLHEHFPQAAFGDLVGLVRGLRL